MSVIAPVALVAASSVAPIVAAAVGYTPANLTADLAGAALVILPYVGAGVAGGLVLMFSFMGIRKGIAFFRGNAK